MAFQVAQVIQDAADKVAALHQVAGKYANIGKKTFARQLLTSASQAAKTLSNVTEKSQILEEIAQQQRILTKN